MSATFERRTPPDEAALDRIVTVARACFARAGVEATRMEDVAREAGISRQYLYRFVSGRVELLELVLVRRLGELGAELEARAGADAPDVAEAIVDQILAGIELGADAEFASLAESMPRVRLNLLLTSGRSPLHAINTRAFGPLFARALADGRLRTDVSSDAMVEWLQGVMTLLSGRDDLDLEARRTMVRAFVLPGLLVDT